MEKGYPSLEREISVDSPPDWPRSTCTTMSCSCSTTMPKALTRARGSGSFRSPLTCGPRAYPTSPSSSRLPATARMGSSDQTSIAALLPSSAISTSQRKGSRPLSSDGRTSGTDRTSTRVAAEEGSLHAALPQPDRQVVGRRRLRSHEDIKSARPRFVGLLPDRHAHESMGRIPGVGPPSLTLCHRGPPLRYAPA